MKSWITTGCILILIFQVFQVIARFTYTNKHECEGDLTTTDLQRWASKSKYVFPKSWETFSAMLTYEEMKKICTDSGLTLPSAYHLHDWLSLQNIARDFTTFADAQIPPILWMDGLTGGENYSILTGNTFDKTKKPFIWRPIYEDTTIKSAPFIIWETTGQVKSPTPVNPLEITSIRIRADPSGVLKSKAYIAEGDADKNSKLDIKIPVCQYPVTSVCYADSTEGTDNQIYLDEFRDYNKEIQYLGGVGSIEFWIGVQPMYFDDASKKCQGKFIGGKPGKLFDGDMAKLSFLSGTEWMELSVLTKYFLNDKLDIFGYGSFVGADATSRWIWNKAGDAPEVQTISEAANLYICYWGKMFMDETKCVADLPKNLVRWRKGSSKYVHIKDWGFYDKAKKKKVKFRDCESECAKNGLYLPSAYHYEDWISLQDLTRDFVKNVKPSLTIPSNDASFGGRKLVFFTGNFYIEHLGRWNPVQDRKDSTNKVIDSKAPYIIWDHFPGNPDSDLKNHQIRNNIRVCNMDGVYYISEGDADDSFDGGEGVLVCQYPTYSPCFKKSSEELATKDVTVFMDDLGDTKDHKWWISLRPDYYEDADLECKKDKGKGYFITSLYTADNSSDKTAFWQQLRNNTQGYLLSKDINLRASFVRAPKSGVHQRWKWESDDLKDMKFDAIIPETAGIRKATNFYLCYSDLKFTSGTKCETDLLKSGFKLERYTTLRTPSGPSKYVYQKMPISGMDYDSQLKACEDIGLFLPSAYHIEDWHSLQDIIREEPTAPFFTGNFFIGNATDERWFPVYEHPDPDINDHTPFIIWESDRIEPDNQIKMTHLVANEISAVEYDSVWYSFERDVERSAASTVSRRLVCMYPTSSTCFINSLEETTHIKKYILKLPMVANYDLWIGFPEYFQQAVDSCKNVLSHISGRLFDGKLSKLTITGKELKDEILKQLKDPSGLDLLPSATFLEYGRTRKNIYYFEHRRWKWTSPTTYTIDQSEVIPHGHPNLYICYYKIFADKTNCEKDLHPSLIQFKVKSKFVFNKNWTLVLNRTEQEKRCNDEGLVLPTAYHIKDWLTLQDLGRLYVKDYADKNGFDWKDKDSKYNRPFFTGNKFNYDITTSPITEKWITNQAHPTIGTDPYIIWDPQFPETETDPALIEFMEYVNNIRLFDYEGKVYISEGNVATDETTGDEFEPSGLPYEGGGMIVCQFPVSSPCFTESKEELDYANDPWLGDDFRYVGQTKNYLWWMGVRPRSYLDQAKADCERIRESTKTGLTGFFIGEYQTTPPAATTDLSIEIEIDELKKLRSFTAGFLKNIDLHPEPIFLGIYGINQWHWILDPLDPSKSKPVPLRQQSHPSYWHKYLCFSEYKTSCP